MEIEIYDYIGDDFAKRLRGDMRGLGPNDPVTVAINSPGGRLDAGLAAYNQLRRHKGPITTRVDGAAFSAATVVMLAGDVRQVADNSMCLIHDPFLPPCPGEIPELKRTLDHLRKLKRSVVNLYHSRTGRGRDELAELMSNETLYTGAEAVHAGFATEMIDAQPVEMCVDLAAVPEGCRDRLAEALAARRKPLTQHAALALSAQARARAQTLLAQRGI